MKYAATLLFVDYGIFWAATNTVFIINPIVVYHCVFTVCHFKWLLKLGKTKNNEQKVHINLNSPKPFQQHIFDW